MNELEIRLMDFAVSIIQSCRKIYLDPISRPMISQITRSSTSIGANYTEAQHAISKKDFRNKVFTAKKEAAETIYWLRILERLKISSDIKIQLKEANEIIRILNAICIKLQDS